MFKRSLLWMFTVLHLTVLLLTAGSLLAADRPFSTDSTTQDVFKLGEIVVTDTAGGIADVGITDTLTYKDIEKTNSKTVADALQFIPGITVTKGRKNEPGIFVHGFGTEKTLFLIDGVPYYETYYGKLNMDQIPVDVVSKIEVTKNAPSVLYGPNAQVAVVNVVTHQGSEKPTFTVKGEIGDYNTYKGSISHGNTIGAVNYWVSFLHETSDGWRLSDDFTPEEATRARKWMPNIDGIHEDGGLRENSDYENNRFWARAGIEPSAGSEYFVSFHYMDSEFGQPLATNEYRIFTTQGDDAGFSTLARFEDYDDWGVDLSGRQFITDALTLRGKLFYHNHTDLYVSYSDLDFLDLIAKSEYKDNYYGGSLIADFSLADAHSGHLSLHYKEDVHEDRAAEFQPFNETQSHTGSIGTEHQYMSPLGIILYAGISYDWFEVDEAEDYLFDDDDHLVGQVDLDTAATQDEINPMIGFTWDFETTSIYGSVAKKTRFPTLSQLFSSTSGNPELEAEKSTNYTLGITKAFSSNVNADISGFYHDISDWISRDYYEDDYSGNEIYANVEDVSMKGFEAVINVRFCDYFGMNFNYTWIDGKNESANRVTENLVNVPENKFGVGFNILIPKVLATVDLQAFYVNGVYGTLPTTSYPDDPKVELNDYFILNSRVAKSFADRYQIYAEIDNLFDEDYEQEDGFPGEGRNVRAGFSMAF